LLIKGTKPEYKNKDGYVNVEVSKIMDCEIIGIVLE
jgi:hypothetical protein